MSFNFKTTVGCNVSLFLFTWVTAFILPLMIFIFSNNFESIKPYSDVVSFLCRCFFPTFCFGYSLFKLAFKRVISFRLGSITPLSVWDKEINYWNFVGVCA